MLFAAGRTLATTDLRRQQARVTSLTTASAAGPDREPESEKEQYRAADGALSGECSPTSHSCIYKEYVLHQLKVVTSKNTMLEGKLLDIEQLVDRDYGTISERARVQACAKAAEIERHCTGPALETARLRAVERKRYRQCSAVIRFW
jgi:hypothetical protein